MEHTRERFAGKRPPASDDIDAALTTELHLSIESFYIFAKIPADRMADTFGYYFQVQWKGFGSTHTKLEKRFDDLITGRGLSREPTDLLATIQEISKRIVDYRTGLIEHPDRLPLDRDRRWKVLGRGGASEHPTGAGDRSGRR